MTVNPGPRFCTEAEYAAALEQASGEVLFVIESAKRMARHLNHDVVYPIHLLYAALLYGQPSDVSALLRSDRYSAYTAMSEKLKSVSDIMTGKAESVSLQRSTETMIVAAHREAVVANLQQFSLTHLVLGLYCNSYFNAVFKELLFSLFGDYESLRAQCIEISG